MTLVKWQPARSLMNWTNDWADEFFGRDWMSERDKSFWYPAVDIQEDDNGYHFELELPGVNKDDVQVSFNNGILSVSGEKKEERKEEKNNYHCYERRFGKFERSFRINSDVLVDKIDAHFKNGILSVFLPKSEISKPKAIEVKVK